MTDSHLEHHLENAKNKILSVYLDFHHLEHQRHQDHDFHHLEQKVVRTSHHNVLKCSKCESNKGTRAVWNIKYMDAFVNRVLITLRKWGKRNAPSSKLLHNSSVVGSAKPSH